MPVAATSSTGLGAAQFATGATVDRLRSFTRDAGPTEPPVAVTLAATDPANPYGAALKWRGSAAGSARPAAADDAATGRVASAVAHAHRPGRKAGALVVLVDGALALYVERGGKTVLTFGLGEDAMAAAARSLAATVRTRPRPAAHRTRRRGVRRRHAARPGPRRGGLRADTAGVAAPGLTR